MSSQIRKGDFLSRYFVMVLVAFAITMVLHTRALRALEPANLCAEDQGFWLMLRTTTRTNDRTARCSHELTKTRSRLASRLP